MKTCYGLFPGFKSDVSSFTPDQFLGGFVPQFAFGCRLYEGEWCDGSSVRFEYPGVSTEKLRVDPKSARCEFYSPAVSLWYKLVGDKSTFESEG